MIHATANVSNGLSWIRAKSPMHSSPMALRFYLSVFIEIDESSCFSMTTPNNETIKPGVESLRSD